LVAGGRRSRGDYRPALSSLVSTGTVTWTARAFGTRPEIYRAASWITLVELASPKMSATVRQAMEAKILAGRSVTAPQIRRARGRLKGGRTAGASHCGMNS
jgi:hypothetical protein